MRQVRQEELHVHAAADTLLGRAHDHVCLLPRVRKQMEVLLDTRTSHKLDE